MTERFPLFRLHRCRPFCGIINPTDIPGVEVVEMLPPGKVPGALRTLYVSLFPAVISKKWRSDNGEISEQVVVSPFSFLRIIHLEEIPPWCTILDTHYKYLARYDPEVVWRNIERLKTVDTEDPRELLAILQSL